MHDKVLGPEPVEFAAEAEGIDGKIRTGTATIYPQEIPLAELCNESFRDGSIHLRLDRPDVVGCDQRRKIAVTTRCIRLAAGIAHGIAHQGTDRRAHDRVTIGMIFIEVSLQ